MKKLFVILTAVALVWAFAGPASAADWNFYGSARMATYWQSSETGKGSTKVEESELQWEGQNNSRIGATVKGETVNGRFELGMTGKDGSDWDPGSGDGIQTRVRRIQGDWNFGAGTLSVGKGYTAMNQFISGQVGRGDNGLLGRGFVYAYRPYFIGLTFGGFQVQFIDPTTSDISDSAGNATGGDVDEILPKIEAAWGMGFDAWNFKLRGGWQYYCIKDVVGTSGTDDVAVNAYALGADGRFNFGPAYVGAGISIARNGANAQWTAGGTFWDGDDDTDDTDTVQGGIVAGFKMSDMVSFEGGFGYRKDDFDLSGVDETTVWEFYLQSNIGLAAGVYLIPEFGYSDTDADGSSNDVTDWYLGAKWQIDF